MKSNMTILYVLLGSILTLTVISIWYLYNNRGGERILELSYRSFLIPVIVAFGLIVWEYLKPVATYKKNFTACISDSPETLRRLLNNPNRDSEGIDEGVMNLCIFHAGNFDELDAHAEKIEILETHILHLISKQYSLHWDIDYIEQSSFFGGGGSMTGAKPDAEKKTQKIELKKLQSMVSQNHVLQEVKANLDLTLPADCIFSIEGDSRKRVISLEDDYFTMSISINRVASAKLPHVGGKSAYLIRKKLNAPLDESWSLTFYGFDVTVEATPKRINKWNPKTIKRLDWTREMSHYLEHSIGWNLIVQQLEKS